MSDVSDLSDGHCFHKENGRTPIGLSGGGALCARCDVKDRGRQYRAVGTGAGYFAGGRSKPLMGRELLSDDAGVTATGAHLGMKADGVSP